MFDMMMSQIFNTPHFVYVQSFKGTNFVIFTVIHCKIDP